MGRSPPTPGPRAADAALELALRVPAAAIHSASIWSGVQPKPGAERCYHRVTRGSRAEWTLMIGVGS